ncbi:TRAF-type zinc finger [Oesophagostomum dentatum]|uniref:TRAF-type zinc finger n=1 Tax=Oesophagostomum dentatum TaxID=61180 RepID=A0A0B1TL60_OESDE|nr:TRAF-type zinc finger [Oesophagostomum dentatum]
MTDELDPLAPRQIVHFTHCISCHLEKCDFQGIVVRCPQCSALLHECKIEDHINEICPKTMVPCINASFGCDRLVRRDKRSRHLERCCASVVVCGREWARYALSPMSKLQMKNWGKRIEAEPERKFQNLPLDIALTLSDQIRNYDGSVAGTAEFKDAENSSDEECRVKEAKLKRKRAMFANCYMCQIDPSSQHLHTLGNESSKYDQIKRVKKREKIIDDFHKMYDLQINFAPECMPEFLVRGENIPFIRAGGALYTRRCLKTFRRTEYADHHLSQHVRSIDSLSDLVVRCPNWMRGCLFYTKRLTPKRGKIRFLTSLDSFSYRPSVPEICGATKSDHPVDSLPPWLVKTLIDYLPNSAIRCLSQTCRELRSVVFACARDRSMVSLVWEKCDGCWVESGIAIDFSVADKTPEYVWEPAKELSNHLAHCEYRDIVEYKENRVPVLASNLEQITKEFMLKLLQRLQYLA